MWNKDNTNPEKGKKACFLFIGTYYYSYSSNS